MSNWQRMQASMAGGGKKRGTSMAGKNKTSISAAVMKSSTPRNKKRKRRDESKNPPGPKETARGARSSPGGADGPHCSKAQPGVDAAGVVTDDGSCEFSLPRKPFRMPGSDRRFLTPKDPHFSACKAQCYEKLAVDNGGSSEGSWMSTSLHQQVAAAFEVMRRQHLFHYDVVSAGRTVSPTFVKRLLVGDAGMTYHYQRLRIFAFPWEDEHSREGDPVRTVRQLNETLVRRARTHLADLGLGGGLAPPGKGRRGRGSCEYNITLINYMEPSGIGKVALKEEPTFGLGTASVSWHADSSLENFSTIGVYQHLLPDLAHGYQGSGSSAYGTNRKCGATVSPPAKPWRVAVRVTGDDITPALAVPLADRATYFMLDDFNHDHHHAVLTGTASRYSSTHRVSVVEKDTWRYIRERCEAARAAAPQALQLQEAALRLLGEVHTEVEMEWVRMFYVQGQRHCKAHSGYWRPIMEKHLLPAWSQMETWTRQAVDALLDHVTSSSLPAARSTAHHASPSVRAYSMMTYILRDRDEKRREWALRYKSQAYAQLDADCRPMKGYPRFNGSQSPLPFDLSEVISQLVQAKKKKTAAVGAAGAPPLPARTTAEGKGAGNGGGVRRPSRQGWGGKSPTKQPSKMKKTKKKRARQQSR